MKTLVFSMLAMAAMVSCTSESDPIEDIDNGQPVEIKMMAGVITVETTKAAIANDGTFTPKIVGWESAEAPTTASAPKWTSAPTSAISGNASNQSIVLTPKAYYNPDATKSTYIRGYYPEGTASGGVVTFANTTGGEDVIMTDLVDAGNKKSTTPTGLTFAHKLSQLNFKVIAGEGFANGITLTSIKVKSVALPTGFDLITGTITYGTATDLSVPDISNPTIATEASVGSAIMVKPISSTTLILEIETSTGTFSDVSTTLSKIDANGGTSYTITLTFKQKEITTTASVTPWESGTGTGDVI